MWICPVCNRPLERQDASFRCTAGHSFDCARSGYVHLLPVQRKHAKIPGDNKLMVAARRRFLEKGFYAPLAQQVCQITADRIEADGTEMPVLLDAGCGEGYYTGKICEELERRGLQAEILGVDISKIALDKAARRVKQVQFAVASVYHLPVASESVDFLCDLFSPCAWEEYRRVIRPGGAMLLVIPGEDHLWELKQAVYTAPYKNEVKGFGLEGFRLCSQREVRQTIRLNNQEDIADLFCMTPYYYKTSRESQARLFALTELTTRTTFELLLYEKMGK